MPHHRSASPNFSNPKDSSSGDKKSDSKSEATTTTPEGAIAGTNTFGWGTTTASAVQAAQTTGTPVSSSGGGGNVYGNAVGVADYLGGDRSTDYSVRQQGGYSDVYYGVTQADAQAAHAVAEQQRIQQQTQSAQTAAQQQAATEAFQEAEARKIYEAAGVRGASQSQEHVLQKYWSDAAKEETKKVMGIGTGGVRTDVWGTEKVQSPRESEQQIQILLADVHIRNTTGDIQVLQGEISDLSIVMDNERAQLISENQGQYDSFSEAMLVQDSATYKEAKFRKERLERELAEKKRYLDQEKEKKAKWEGMSLTEAAGEAFTGGLSYTDPMSTDINLGQPITTGTLKYDDKIPTLNIATPDTDVAFAGLQLPQIDTLKLPTVDVLPPASAEEQAETFTPIKEGQSLEDYQAQVLGTPDQAMASAETFVLAEPELETPKTDALIFQTVMEDAEKGQEDSATAGMFLAGYDEEDKPKWVEIAKEPSTVIQKPYTVEVRDGKVVKIDPTTGKVMKAGEDIERVLGERIDPLSEEGKTIQKIYAQQEYNKYLNELQKERFDAAKEGKISVGSFLSEAGTSEQKSTLDWFEERGIPLDTPMGAIDFTQGTGAKFEPADKTTVQLTDTLKAEGITDKKVLADAEGKTHDVYTASLNLQGAEGWAKEGKEEMFDTKGVVLKDLSITAREEYNKRFAERAMEKLPDEDQFILFPAAAAEMEDSDAIEVAVIVPRDEVVSTVQAWTASGKGLAGISGTDEPDVWYENPSAGDKYQNQMAIWEESYKEAGDAQFTHMYIQPVEGKEGEFQPTPLGIDVLRSQGAVVTDAEFDLQQQ